MARISVLGICITTLLVTFGCSNISSPQASETKTDIVTNNPTPCDVNWVQIEQTNHIVKRTLVASKHETLDGSRVLYFKNDLVTITVSVEDAIRYFEKHFAAHPNLRDEKALADRLRSERGMHSEYHYKDFSPQECGRLDFCIASLLQEGSFLITLNETGQTVPEIYACEYSWYRGALDASGGRMFFLKDGKRFYRTMDWIS